jgi:hypothetical protein
LNSCFVVTDTMTPYDFTTKWGPGGPAFYLNEEQGAQSHFIDLCDLLGVPKPGSEDAYIFEKQTLETRVVGEARGYADVFKRGAFAWENKAPGKNLDAALKQLLNYSSALSNPPILVVCDRLQIRVQTQFTGHPTEKFTVLLAELAQPDKLAQLRRIWLDPESFRPKITSRDITEVAAKSFATLADNLRKRGPAQANDPAGFQAHADDVAHFLTQCLFCFFAEDVGLLPGRMFDGLVNNRGLTSDKLTSGMTNLFNVMRDGGMYGNDDIPWFNGGLFKRIKVPPLNVLDVTELRNAAALNWSAIDVSIFGTLFERGLDPSKRSQLGAHYTDPATIMSIIEPVLERQLLQIWELLASDLIGLMAKSKRKHDANYKLAHAKFTAWLDRLKEFRVLDPACGSGNFLFLGLKALKDIEHKSHLAAEAMGLDREADLVTGPHNMLGIELNEYAAELARLTVWIGELQWRLSHGYEFKKNPVLEPLDNIECRDALLDFLPLPLGEGGGEGSPLPDSSSAGWAAGQRPAAHTLCFLKSPPASAPLPDQLVNSSSNVGSDPSAQHAGSDPKLRGQLTKAVEAAWPKASIVIGNPPFLGGSKKRRELGDAYFEALDSVFTGRVPGGADLVCYWFARALDMIEKGHLTAAGLVATNSIRGGANRQVLKSICESSRIYEAWSDEGWVNDGADVRVSLICFGNQGSTRLNGVEVESINADLSFTATNAESLDLTQARRLNENFGICFLGPEKNGKFDISGQQARQWLSLPNVNGLSSSPVLKPRYNGIDLQRRYGDGWVIDFGTSMSEAHASCFEKPFEWVQLHVKPIRASNADKNRRLNWWRFGRTGEDFRAATRPLKRYLAMSAHTKHIVFSWLPTTVMPDKALVVVARDSDLFFGLLNSRFHELWSLMRGTFIGVGNDPRYNAGNCFETFPFPNLTPKEASQAMVGLVSGATSKRPKAVERLVPTPPAPGLVNESNQRATAEKIAKAAKHLNDLRENWLNPPEWTDRVPEVTPLGMATSPYPDRIVAKPGHDKDLADRTLTKLYNQRPAWLDAAHKQLDAAVALAYGWADYTAGMPDEEILKRLLALNLGRAT